MSINFTHAQLAQQRLPHAYRKVITALALTIAVFTNATTNANTDPTANANTNKQTCAEASTQADMNRCAYEDFETASSSYALRYKELSKSLPVAQRNRLQNMQNAWLKFRTEACRFESGPTTGGSIQGFVYWQCAARMTRERAVALQSMATCREGDITCTKKSK